MHFHQARHPTQNKPSPHQAQSTTCCECMVNQAPTRPGDPHNMLSACLPKCQLQKFNPWRQGNAPAYDASNGKPELMWRFGRDANRVRIAGGAHTRFPHAVSVLIMDQADKDFSSVSTSRPQNQTPASCRCLIIKLEFNPKH